jgi:hypothetical protein
MPATESEAERRADAAAQRAEAAENRAIAAERRAAEAERRVAANLASKADASVQANATRPSQPKLITPATTPTAQLTSKEIPVMSSRKQALFRDVASATAALASARQGLEDARSLARAGFPSDVVFALHVEGGRFNEWLRVSEAFQACRD